MSTNGLNETGLNVTRAVFQAAQRAIDYALNAMVGAEPLVPFTMTWHNDEVVVERFMYGAYDDSIEQAMRTVNAQDRVDTYAVVWSGYVLIDGAKRDAVVLEVGVRDEPTAAQLAQPYAVVAGRGVVEADGDILALGESLNLATNKFDVTSMSNHLLKPAYVSTEAYTTDVKSQPFAQMPVALICLAANLFPGEEESRITLGVRALQAAEAKATVSVSRRVFTIVTTAVASGDLMQLLRSDRVEDLTQIVVNGVRELKRAVSKGLVWESDARAYLDDVRAIACQVLAGSENAEIPSAGAKLLRLLQVAPADDVAA